jgi:signal transduction histidine kinase/CheY-like chemotaxis protein
VIPLEHHAPGDALILNFVYTPKRNVHGQIDGVLVSAVDVTAQVRARNAIDALRERAESANRAKDAFLAMLGHELRNPMAPILTALQLMKLRDIAAVEKERMVIERQVDHLVRLVDDLLDVSRITGGKVELRRTRLEMAAVVASALEQASPLLEQREHVVTVDVPREGLAVYGDATRLAQVVANLLVNAAKYTEPRGKVSIVAERDGEEAVLRIRDTGIGIPADLLPNVFELFTQDHQAIDRARGGLGLGLAIVRSIVTMHGGTAKVESAGRGSGSEFTITIPLASEDAAIPAVPNAPRPRLLTRNQRVLIVDDNEDAAELLSEMLQRLGYTTRVALDGPSALQTLDQFDADVALLDIGLPVMDGYELARRLRAHPRLGAIQLVALTGYGQESDRRRATEAGFDHHLAKPVKIETLATILATSEPHA